MFSFTYPYLLLALLVWPLVFWWVWRFRREPSVLVPGAEAYRKSSTVKRKKWFSWSYWCYFAALGLLLLGLAQPRWGTEHLVIRTEGIDIMLALDLSGSMDIFDLPKGIDTQSGIAKAIKSGVIRNRLNVAKEALTKFVEQRPNDRFGLIGFAEAAYSFAPPTLDHGLIVDLLNSLEPNCLYSSSTGITSPIIAGVKRLGKSTAPRRVLVLFTDGVNNVQHAATPLEAAELAKAKDVVIYTVGIGGERAVFPHRGWNGLSFEQVPSEFDEPLLRKIAQITGGRYFHASDETGLIEVMDEINKLEKTSLEQPKIVDYHHYAPNLALAALCLLLVGFSLECTVKLRLP